MVRIENWSITSGDSDPYKAPEQISAKLYGAVYGHPNPYIFDGEVVTTSRINSVNGRIVQTNNNEYELGTADPNYVIWYKENYPDGKCDLESDNPLEFLNCPEG